MILRNYLYILTFILLLCTVNSKAQFSFGVKGGLNISSYTGRYVEGSNAIFGYHAGLFAHINHGEYNYLGIEALYSTKGSRYDDEIANIVQRISYIDIPVLYHFSNEKGIGVMIGPQFSIKAGGTNKIVPADLDYSHISMVKIFENDAIKSFDLSIVGGFMFVIENIFIIEARTGMSLTSFIDKERMDFNEDQKKENKGRILNIQICVGINIFRSKRHE